MSPRPTRRTVGTIAGALALALAAQMTPALAEPTTRTVERQPATAAAAAADPTESPSYSQEVLADNPIAYYRLGESSGSIANDLTGNDLTATYPAGAELARPGVLHGDPDAAVKGGTNGALNSDGALLPSGNEPRTLELWAELTCTSTDVASCSYGGSPTASPEGEWLIRYGNRFGLSFAQGSLRLYWGPGPEDYAQVGTPFDVGPTQEFASRTDHYAITYDGATAVVYIDGQVLWSGAVQPNTVTPGGGLQVGSQGRVDEAAVFATALSVARISAHWARGGSATACGETPTDPYGLAVLAHQPVGYYRFQDVSTTPTPSVVHDSSGRCANAVAVGEVRTTESPVGSPQSRAIRATLPSPARIFRSDPTADAGPRSVEAWFRTMDQNSDLLSFPEVGLSLRATDDRQLTLFGNSYQGSSSYPTRALIDIHAPKPVLDGEWHLVDIALDKGADSLSVLLDGTVVWSGSASIATYPVQSGVPPRVGMSAPTPLAAEIAEVAWFDALVTPADVAARYALVSPSPIESACGTPAADPYSTAVLADAPLRYYRLDDTANLDTQMAPDASSSCVNGLLGIGTMPTGSVIPGAGDKAATAWSTGLVRAPSTGLPAGSNARTIEFWMKPSAQDPGFGFLRQLGTYGLGGLGTVWLARYGADFGIAILNGDIVFRFGPGAGDYLTLDSTGPDGQWHHIVASYDGTTARGYYDGVGVANRTATVATDVSAGPLFVGKALSRSPQLTQYVGSSVEYLTMVPARFDEVAVYGSALTAQRVRAHWQAGPADGTDQCPAPRGSGHEQIVLGDAPSRYFRLDGHSTSPEAGQTYDLTRCARASLGPGTTAVPGALVGDPDSAIGSTSTPTTGSTTSTLQMFAASIADPTIAFSIPEWTRTGTGGANVTPRTIEFWGRTTGTDPLVFRMGSASSFTLKPDGSLSLPGESYEAPLVVSVPNPGQWHHYAITSSGVLFVDGIETGSWAFQPADAVFGFAGGQVDDVVVFNRLLASERIAAHAQAGRLADTTTVASVPAGPWEPDQIQHVEVTVAAVSGSTIPTGTVSLLDNDVSVASVPVDPAGHVAFDLAFATGPHRLIARYSGDPSFVPSESKQAARRIGEAPTPTVQVRITPETPAYGQAVTAIVTVGVPDVDLTTLRYHLTLDGTALPSGVLDGPETSIELPELTVGSHSLSATVEDGLTVNETTSDTLSFTVPRPQLGLTTWPADGAEIPYGQRSMIIQPTGLGSTYPTGVLTATLDEAAVPVSPYTYGWWFYGWVSTLPDRLALGQHTVTFRYSGDSVYAPTEVARQFTVVPAATTTSLSLTINDSQYGTDQTDSATPVTMEAQVSQLLHPDGEVEFRSGNTVLGSVPAEVVYYENSTSPNYGRARFTTTLPVGDHALTAVYIGTDNYLSSTSTPSNLKVRPPLDATIETGPATVGGQPFPVRVTVRPRDGASGTVPTGSVSINAGGSSVSATLDATGTATATVTPGSQGGDVPVSVYYGGDANFSRTTFTGTHRIELADTTTSITFSPDPSPSGSQVRVISRIAPVAPGAGSPTGLVSFYLDDATAPFATDSVGYFAPSEARAWITIASAGEHRIRAVYGGSSAFATSSAEVTHAFGVGTSTTLTSSSNPVLRGAPLTLLAVVAPIAPATATPTGTLKLQRVSDGYWTDEATSEVPADGRVSFTVAPAAGTTRYRAVYVPNGSTFVASTSSAVDQVVNLAGTTVAITTDPTDTVYGQPTLLTAQVSAPGADPSLQSPTGWVTFSVDGRPVGSAAVAAGQATLAVSSLDVGDHLVTARYGGSADYQSASSAEATITVAQGATAVQLSSSANPSTTAQPAEFVVTLAAASPASGTPTGTVELLDGSTVIATAVVAVDGTARFTPPLSAGQHTLRVEYRGDAQFLPSASSDLVQMVGAGSTVALTVSPSSSTFGQAVTLTAAVTAVSGGTPTGSVTFYDDAVEVGTVALDAQARASLTTATLPAGERHLTARYSGDAAVQPSVSDEVAHLVGPASASIVLTSDVPEAVSGQRVGFVATVTPGAGTPTGFVAFYDAEVLLGTAPLGTDGAAVFSSTALGMGERRITATYGGSATSEHATSPAVTVTVTKASPTVGLSVSASPARAGDDVRITATVTPQHSGTPSGSVTIRDGATELAVVILDDRGVARFNTRNLAVGGHELRAEYGGDERNLATSSTVVPLAVNASGDSATTVTAQQGPITVGSRASFRITVAAASGGAAGRGEVRVTDDGVVIGTAALDEGAATFAVDDLTPGVHHIGATFPGDADLAPSASPTVDQEVRATNALVATPPPLPVAAGEVSPPFTLELRDASGAPSPAGVGGVTITLATASPSGRFVDPSGATTTAVTIPTGQTAATVRYVDTTAGSATVTFRAESGFGAAPISTTVAVVAGPIDHLVLSPVVATVAPGGSQSYTALGADRYGNTTDDQTNAALFTVSGGGTCTGATCTAAAAGSYSVTGSVTGPSGTVVGTARLIGDHAPEPTLDVTNGSGTGPRDVAFEVSALDADDDPLIYHLDFGDGTPPQSGPMPADTIRVVHRYAKCVGCLAVLTVSDGKSEPAPYVPRPIAIVAPEPLTARPGDPVETTAGTAVRFDATNSTPAQGIEQYQWEFGDGQTATGKTVEHAYATAGRYTTRLTVVAGGETSSANSAVNVIAAPLDGVVVTLTGSGSPLDDATVVVQDGTGVIHPAVALAGGRYRIDGLGDGSHVAFAYTTGFLPGSAALEVAEGTGEATLDLAAGDVGATSLTSKAISPDEARERGIDPDAPGNQNVYEFQIRLSFENQPVVISGTSAGGTGLVGTTWTSNSSPTPNPCSATECVVRSGGYTAIGTVKRNQLMWLIIPGRARWAKELFAVRMQVTNLAAAPFQLTKGTATLELPAGLSLAETMSTAQTLTQDIPTIGGRLSETAEWIVRGDTEGLYRLAAEYHGLLDPVGAPVTMRAETDDANDVRVWGASALRMTVDADDGASALSPYVVRVRMDNVADVAAYNVMVSLRPEPDPNLRRYMFQPAERFDDQLGVIPKNGTKTTHDFRVVPFLSNPLNLERSFVAATGGSTEIATTLVSHPVVGVLPAPELDDSYRLEWTATPGAVGYQLYGATDDNGFDATPLVEIRPEVGSTVPIPGSDLDEIPGFDLSRYRYVAVSTLLADPARPGREINALHHALFTSGSSFTKDACRAYGWADYAEVPGNFVMSATDASVATPGPGLSVTRTYNSHSRRIGPMGVGWTFDYDMHWAADDAGGIGIVYGDGRCLPFLRDPAPSDATAAPTFSLAEGQSEYATLVGADDGGFLFTQKDHTAYRFDSDGRLLSITDGSGRRVDLAYAAVGDTVELRDIIDVSSGRALHVTWDRGLIASIATDPVSSGGTPAPLVWKYTYDGNDLVSVCDPRDSAARRVCTRYRHDRDVDPDGRITQVIRPRGFDQVSLTYDSRGRVASETDGENHTTSHVYTDDPEHEGMVIQTTTDPLGNTTTKTIEGTHFRVVRTAARVDEGDGEEEDQTNFLDGDGYPDEFKDAEGRTTSVTYDSHGNPLSTSEPGATSADAPNTAYTQYDQRDNPVVERDENSANSTDNTNATITTYDAFDRPIAITSPSTPEAPQGIVHRFAYATGAEPAVGGGTVPPGMLLADIDPSTRAATYSYYRTGDIAEEVDQNGLRTVHTYDELGRRTSSTAYSTAFPAGVTTAFTYDLVGNLVRRVDPVATNAVSGERHQLQVDTTYDLDGNVTRVVESDTFDMDPSRTTSTDYDRNGRVVKVTDAEGGETTTEYDAAGRAIRTTDALGRKTRSDYDKTGKLVKVTLENFADPDRGGDPRPVTLKESQYDKSGLVTSEKDVLKRETVFVYDASGRLLTTTLKDFDKIGGGTRDIVLEQVVEYDKTGKPLRQASAGGLRTVTTKYDALGRVTESVFDPTPADPVPAGRTWLNRKTTYTYDAVGNLTATELSDASDPSSRKERTVSTYDDARRLTSSTVVNDGNERLTTAYEYDEYGRQVKVTDPGLAVSSTTYDEVGRVSSVTSPEVPLDGGPTMIAPKVWTGYDTYGNPTTQKDARGNVTTSTFDRLGRKISETRQPYTRSDGQTIASTVRTEYDKVGNVVARVDAAGNRTDLRYDSLNRLVRQDDPAIGDEPRGKQHFEYDDAGNQTATVDQTGARTERTYDDLDRVRTLTQIVRRSGDPERIVTAFDYDDAGNQTWTKNDLDGETKSEYTAAGELRLRFDEANKKTEFAYDVASRQVLRTDPLGRKVQTTYDLAGRKTSETRSGGGLALRTSYAYDRRGNVIAETSPRQITKLMGYDLAGRLVSVAEPTGGAPILTQYGYDASGNLTRMTDGNGHTTVYTWTPWDQVDSTIEPATASTPAAVDRTYTTAYDRRGLPERDIEPGGVEVTRTFDELGRTVRESGTGPGVTPAVRSFGYDQAGRRTSVNHPAQRLSFTYDDRGLLLRATGGAGISQFEYDHLGRLTTKVDASGKTTFSYTARGEIAGVGDPLTGQRVSYAFDDAGQPTRATYGSGGVTRSFGYDGVGRLTTDTLSDGSGAVRQSLGYTYDENSNVTSQNIVEPGNSAAGLHQYSYDQADRLVAWTAPSGAVETYEWDGASNRVAVGAQRYTFDERNRLLGGTDGVGYEWTARGTLARQTTGATSVTFDYDAFGRQTDYNDRVAYAYDGLDRVARRAGVTFKYQGTDTSVVSDRKTTYATDPTGRIISARTGGATVTGQFVAQNLHNDVTSTFDSNGAMASSSVYEPFGDPAGSTGSSGSRGFQGSYLDPASDHYWMAARWYSPDSGGFDSRDTVFGDLGESGTLNRFTYGRGSPITFDDQEGRASVRVGRVYVVDRKGDFNSLQGSKKSQKTKKEKAKIEKERCGADRERKEVTEGAMAYRVRACHFAAGVIPAGSTIFVQKATAKSAFGFIKAPGQAGFCAWVDVDALTVKKGAIRKTYKKKCSAGTGRMASWKAQQRTSATASFIDEPIGGGAKSKTRGRMTARVSRKDLGSCPFYKSLYGTDVYDDGEVLDLMDGPAAIRYGSSDGKRVMVHADIGGSHIWFALDYKCASPGLIAATGPKKYTGSGSSKTYVAGTGTGIWDSRGRSVKCNSTRCKRP